jgi:hypothetical protein
MFAFVRKYTFGKYNNDHYLFVFINLHLKQMEGLYYPDHGDSKFQEKLASRHEFQTYRVPRVEPVPSKTE